MMEAKLLMPMTLVPGEGGTGGPCGTAWMRRTCVGTEEAGELAAELVPV